MALPEFQTQIRVPKRQLERAAGDFTSTPCIKLLIMAAKYVAQQRHARISNVLYGDSGAGESSLFMHRSCLITLCAPTLPQGITLTLDKQGRLCFYAGKGQQENHEAKAIFDQIAVVFSSKVAQEVLSTTGYDTDVALSEEGRYRFRIRVTGTHGYRKAEASISKERNDPAKVVKVVVVPTTNLYLFLEGFTREEEAEEIKGLRERCEYLGLLLYEVKRDLTRC